MRKSIFALGLVALLAVSVSIPAQAGEWAGNWKKKRIARILARMDQKAAEDLKTIQVNGVRRTYLLRTPPQARQNPQKRRALVIVLHGGGGNAHNAESMSGFTRKARQEGFFVVYPNGTGKMQHILLTWNSTHCCAVAMKNKLDDIGFIAALIDKLEQNYSIDPTRIFVTGMSNGGMMSHQLGISLSGRIAAIAPVVGGVFGDERIPQFPVSAMIFNGLQDTNVPYNGGLGDGPGSRFGSWDGTPLKPALAQSQFWARADHCNTHPAQSTRGQLTVYDFACPGGVDVQQVIVNDGGHSWPGGKPGRYRGADQPSQSINATDAMWKFFKAHPKR